MSEFDFKSTKWMAELKQAFKACDHALKIVKKYYGKLESVDVKHLAGLVTDADRDTENEIKAVVLGEFTQDRFWGEEFGGDSNAESDRIWYVDPIDGTTNFVHQIPFFCTSIGFEAKDRVRVGVIDAPELSVRYWAVEGLGAYRLKGSQRSFENIADSEAITVSTRTEFKEGLFATGFSASDQQIKVQMQMIALAVQRARGIRRLGAAALDLCLVAEGTFDGFWEKNLQPWDTAAGSLLVREAGGVVTDYLGTPFHPQLRTIIAGNKEQQKSLRGLMGTLTTHPILSKTPLE